jgi:SAM-dependent methyltransferase
LAVFVLNGFALMKKRLLELLVCPDTKSKLELVDAQVDGLGHVASGKLISEEGRIYPIRGFIPRFVESDRYVDSFSLQRRYMMKRFDQWKAGEDRVQEFFYATGFDLNKIAPHRSLFLDVGCGYGRFCQTIGGMDNEIIGVDMSTTSIELAYKYVGKNDNVHLVQCDLTRLPFRREMFDYIFSIGVLHHTPDTRASFDSIVPYLAHGGRVAIWVYSPDAKKMDNKVRKLTTKLPKVILFYLCLATPLTVKLYRYVRGFPQDKRGYWPIVMGWFDSWSPKYASVHAPDEVLRWFENQNLSEIQVLNRRTAVSGKRA